ncbi:aldehyde dehydrogenase family protein [Bdellovibrio svalbardensis]|uniref:Aldehyde dehydrogenase n=1 Tax=Bdellovibrio svalbardensis TaxID=2972972 RepID=A0ABT6DKE8_9BACT|nr:aldehyde dehydrogenase family protein [Bdellovibrio svalbardensis]MDG0816316.1 aldehyde dehydrogenase family protein [Bdellovibrio svalbardensis]
MFEQLYLHQKHFSLQLRKDPVEIRLEHLKNLELMIDAHQKDFVEALKNDFAKPEMETLTSEIYPLLIEIRHAQKQLRQWMTAEKVSAPLFLKGTQNFIHYEPRGVCLIIAPWNYPLFLTLGPMISAIAAGNTVVLKPSELASHTSALLARLIKATFAEEHITVVEGGVENTQALLKLPFDHIFFTGSTTVGKIVMEAAAKNLSSVTLELGGKSPTIVDITADLNLAATKIIWAKFLNAGQTCVAPDYLFVQESVYSQFIAALRENLNRIYGKTPEARKANKDFARIISNKHTTRLKEMLEDSLANEGQILYGGDIDVTANFLAPTVIDNVDVHSRLMQEEIFGPILPIMKYKDFSEVIHFINERPKPLALYIYSHSEMNIEQLTRETSSGGLVINDSVIHLANGYLPFGGVGDSGMGNCHGIHGFRTFSHAKGILRQSWGAKLLGMIYPPYTSQKLEIIKNMIRWKL